MQKHPFYTLATILNPGRSYLYYWIALIITQSIGALNTYSIAKLGESVSTGCISIEYFIIFCITLILAYPPGLYILYLNQKMTYESYYQYIQLFSKTLSNKLEHLENKSFKKLHYPLLTNESYQVIDKLYQYHFTVTAYSMCVVFNLLVFVHMFDNTLLISYGVGSFLGVFIILLLKSKIAKSSKEYQENKILVQDILQTSWDTIIINNELNKNEWDKSLDTHFHKRVSSSLKMLLVREITTISSMLVVLLPILINMTYKFLYAEFNVNMFGIFVATLHKQVQLVQYMQTIFSYQAMFSQIKTHLEGILSPLLEINEKQDKLENRIQWNLINWNFANTLFPDNLSDLLNILSKIPPGQRITISGPNGSGKSSLLKIIKTKTGKKAYYLPAHHTLFFEDQKQGSTGETFINNVQYILKHAQANILLLDEWNANLSPETTQKVHNLLKEVMKDKITIIEVLHNQIPHQVD